MSDEHPSAAASSAPCARPSTGAGMPDWVRFPLVLAVVGAISAGSLGTVYGLTAERIRAAQGRKVELALASILGERWGRAEKRSAEGFEYYELFDRQGARVGVGAEVTCPDCYNKGEPIRLLVVFDPGLERVLGARVVASKETPGLGEKANEAPASRSIADILARRPAKSRVVLAEGGTLVGCVERRPDNSVAVSLPSGTRTLGESEVAAVQEAPFPPAFMDQFTGRKVAEARLVRDGGKIDAITGATVTSRAVARGVERAFERLRSALAEKR